MNILEALFLILSAAGLNTLIYFLFKSRLLYKPIPAMKFLFINIVKDVLWTGFWVIQLENNTANFLLIIGVFLTASVFLYSKVIRLLNRS